MSIKISSNFDCGNIEVIDAGNPQAIRLIRAYDINLDRFPCRLDLLYGWATLYPELASRVAS